MDKKLFIHLQGGRKVSGVLRGYDLFLNLVIDDALEETTPGQKNPIGTVVSIVEILLILVLNIYRSFEGTM
jgi:small nuclear ribonucleoprotein G